MKEQIADFPGQLGPVAVLGRYHDLRCLLADLLSDAVDSAVQQLGDVRRVDRRSAPLFDDTLEMGDGFDELTGAARRAAPRFVIEQGVMEACLGTRVTRRTRRLHFVEQRIAVAIVAHGHDMLSVAGGLAFVPKRLTRTAP